VDESATGSVNFFVVGEARFSLPTSSWSRPRRYDLVPMHLRAPSSAKGTQAFVWAVVFFLFMWLGALAVDMPNGAAFVISLVLAAVIFLLVRTRGSAERTDR
jgi:Flp pilus assembly protein TadB